MAEEKKLIEPQIVNVESNKIYQHELFTIINDHGVFRIALGNQVVTRNEFESREAAEHYLDCKPWEVIFNSVTVMIEKLYKVEYKKIGEE